MGDVTIYRKEIGIRLKQCRIENNMTQACLAEKVGLETKSYANIERGANLFSVEILIKLMSVLGTSADYILIGQHTYETPVTRAINRLSQENAARLEQIVLNFCEAVE